MNPFRFPLSFSLLVGVEVWDHTPTADQTTLSAAFSLTICDVLATAYVKHANEEDATEWAQARTNEHFVAAVELALKEGVVL